MDETLKSDPTDGVAVMEGPAPAEAGRPAAPLALLGEMTHRCPLQCPYCSNPLELEKAAGELTTAEWKRVMDESFALGALQFHFSGGEPTLRRDLAELVKYACDISLYTNLITSGVLLNKERLQALYDAGLYQVQLSFQDSDAASANRIGGYKGGHQKKLEVARLIREVGLPLTVNAVMHRQNLGRLREVIDMTLQLGAARLEVANVQYYGWALKNRAALMPTFAQLEEATRIIEESKERLKGRLVFDYVVPDYYAKRPKKCMGGWGRQFFNISPSGKVLPCHAAESIAGMTFESVRDHSIEWIWNNSPAFNAFRGTAWMPEPCATCEYREIDWGGCRCQAFALTGNAANTDPACQFSPLHDKIFQMAESEAATGDEDFVYRRIGGNAPGKEVRASDLNVT